MKEGGLGKKATLSKTSLLLCPKYGRDYGHMISLGTVAMNFQISRALGSVEGHEGRVAFSM